MKIHSYKHARFIRMKVKGLQADIDCINKPNSFKTTGVGILNPENI